MLWRSKYCGQDRAQTITESLYFILTWNWLIELWVITDECVGSGLPPLIQSQPSFGKTHQIPSMLISFNFTPFHPTSHYICLFLSHFILYSWTLSELNFKFYIEISVEKGLHSVPLPCRKAPRRRTASLPRALPPGLDRVKPIATREAPYVCCILTFSTLCAPTTAANPTSGQLNKGNEIEIRKISKKLQTLH